MAEEGSSMWQKQEHIWRFEDDPNFPPSKQSLKLSNPQES